MDKSAEAEDRYRARVREALAHKNLRDKEEERLRTHQQPDERGDLDDRLVNDRCTKPKTERASLSISTKYHDDTFKLPPR